MSLPYPNPSLDTATNPYFQDNDFARGVQLRNNNVSIWGNLQFLLDTITNNLWTPGMYMEFAGTSAPAGWLACDGASYLRAAYPGLFAVIGTIYGSVDGTHFNVPDIRGITFVGSGANGTMTRADGSAYDGGTVGAKRNDQLQGHVHSVSKENAAGGNQNPLSPGQYANPAKTGGPEDDGTNGPARYGNETRPAQMAALICIKI